MDTLYQLLEWNPVQVGSTFQGGGVGCVVAMASNLLTSSDTRSEAIPFPRSEANYFLRSEATPSPHQSPPQHEGPMPGSAERPPLGPTKLSRCRMLPSHGNRNPFREGTKGTFLLPGNQKKESTLLLKKGKKRLHFSPFPSFKRRAFRFSLHAPFPLQRMHFPVLDSSTCPLLNKRPVPFLRDAAFLFQAMLPSLSLFPGKEDTCPFFQDEPFPLMECNFPFFKRCTLPFPSRQRSLRGTFPFSMERTHLVTFQGPDLCLYRVGRTFSCC